MNSRAALIRFLNRRMRTQPGRPSTCSLCDEPSEYTITNDMSDNQQMFVCGGHVGDVITIWTFAHETTVTRL